MSFLALRVTEVQGETKSEALIKQGLDLRRSGRNVDALAKFESAYRLEQTPRAAAQWGLCLQAVARWSEADPLLEEALSATQDNWIRKYRGTLRESQEALKAHVGRIEVIGDPPGAIVFVAGREVGKLPLTAAVSVNEGSVDVEVEAPGYKRATRTLVVTGASHQRVVLRLEVTSTSKPISSPDRETASEAPTRQTLVSISQPATSPTSLAGRHWVWVGISAVVLGVVVASVALTADSGNPKFDVERKIP